ncbi:hypothetical protein ACWEHA_35915 [Amycolatopsis nivea]
MRTRLPGSPPIDEGYPHPGAVQIFQVARASGHRRMEEPFAAMLPELNTSS